jgi:SAM-dependent methyltransferase
MFSKSARFYDAIYGWKDYAAEAARLREIIAARKRSPGNALLDVACGTGQHLAYLKGDFQAEGLDLDPELLAIARERHPELTFHQADMMDFSLNRRFDVVTCLFSAVGYVRTVDGLNRAIVAMGRHVSPGGLLLVEPWFGPDQYSSGRISSTFVDEPDLRVARMNVSDLRDGVSILDFHYLVADASGVRHFVEHHELGLFTREQYLSAFAQAGLVPIWDEAGIAERGLVIGEQP